MTFTEIMKLITGVLFGIFILYGLWMFSESIVDKVCSFFEDGEK